MVGPHQDVSKAIEAFRQLLGFSDMLAYLVMMAQRLVELHRVLKSSGSLYLHCDPAASHYLKVLLDAVFDARNMVNEIVWKRTYAHGDAGGQGAQHFGRVHDTILFYAKQRGEAIFNPFYQPYDPDYIEKTFKYKDPDGRKWQSLPMDGPGGAAKGNPSFEVLGVTRYWRYSRETMNRLLEEGRIHQSKPGVVPREKGYLDESKGVLAQDLWTDIRKISSRAKERLGYPTQKPELLLDRVIKVSSNEDCVVLDPFCGCGTAIASAQRLGRTWIGIDITHLAISLIKHRLADTYGDSIEYTVVGEPTSLEGALALALDDRFQFQYWALGLVEARPHQEKKGADHGIDGRIYFIDEKNQKAKQVIISVKSGKPKVNEIRDLKGVLDREKAQIGVYITLNNPTNPMRKEAASSGFYESPGWNSRHPRIQILTIQEILDGKRIDMPPIKHVSQTFRKAKRATEPAPPQGEMFGTGHD
ncbi:MAG: site-specific DNA-methyltransferase [Rhodothermia bacterium]|nr:MAG: site-specific DNA-methyltransferase [Rhodothermia bacterium]